MLGSPSSENAGPLSEIVCHERYTILCIRFRAKRVTRIFVTLLWCTKTVVYHFWPFLMRNYRFNLVNAFAIASVNSFQVVTLWAEEPSGAVADFRLEIPTTEWSPSSILIGIVRRRKNLFFSKWRRKALCEFRLGNACASIKPRWLCSFYQQHSWWWHSGYLFRNGLEEIRTLFLGLFRSSSSCLKKSSYINAPGDRYILSKCAFTSGSYSI